MADNAKNFKLEKYFKRLLAMKPSLSVISTFFNEEKILPVFIKRLRKTCKKICRLKLISRYEIILVDDASTDNSKSVILSENKEKDIMLVVLSRNFGVAESNFAGFDHSNGDLVVYLDCDLQDPPELIEKMVSEWSNYPGTEVVYTTRTRRKGEHWIKMLLTKVGYRLIHKISSIYLPPDSGDFKLLTRKVVNLLRAIREPRPYTRGLVSWLGFQQRQILYERDERFDGRENTKMPAFSGKVINHVLDSALISFTDMPLKSILFFGGAISLFSLCYLFVILVQKILGLYVPGWPALMTAILLLGGVQMIMLGFVGLYVSAIFRQTKNRPLYVVDKVIGRQRGQKRDRKSLQKYHFSHDE
jgi:dolichol-phosphate mannosyltransferase